jgi:ABC-type sugar transport system substrate-binding protein
MLRPRGRPPRVGRLDGPSDITREGIMRSLVLAGVLALGLAATTRKADAADVRVFVRHEVSDYAAWKKAYDDFAATRKKLGVAAQDVFRSIDNPNDLTITHDFKTLQKAKAFASSPELKAAMMKAGVTGTPQIWYTTKAGK